MALEVGNPCFHQPSPHWKEWKGGGVAAVLLVPDQVTGRGDGGFTEAA